MSRLFDRSYSLAIDGQGERVTITGLDISFTVRKSRSGTPNTCDLKVWNAAPNTRNIAKDSAATLELSAGYGGSLTVLTRAEISNARIEHMMPNVLLDVQAAEGVRTLRETSVSISHAGGSSVGTVISEIQDAIGLPLRQTGVDLSATLSGGFAHVGRVSKALGDLVARIGGSWSIQNGELQILGPDGEVAGAEAFVLSPLTGMIDSPTPIEEQIDTEKSSTQERRGYNVTTLLDPRLQPGGVVQIASREVSGAFVIDAVEHRGDYAGNEWHSILTCLERAQ